LQKAKYEVDLYEIGTIHRTVIDRGLCT